MIIITGAAGFIGSCLAAKLNELKFYDLIFVDNFSNPSKISNWDSKRYTEKVERKLFFDWIQGKEKLVQFVIHIGARTDTSEKSTEIFNELNLNYTQKIWNLCTEFQIPLIYASSAATYGDGKLGFKDDESLIPSLKPLNPYAVSKQDFDLWALKQDKKPFFWAGLKFFNVYGPNEYHKGRMASVIFHAFNQIKESGKLKLFRSHNPDFQDGGQLRDFIYVKDLIDVILFFMNHRKNSGIYNLGTGKARSFFDLGANVFKSLDLKPNIEYIDIPQDIRESYQYFTEASMEKLRQIGYNQEFTSLEDGVSDYVKNYLNLNKGI